MTLRRYATAPLPANASRAVVNLRLDKTSANHGTSLYLLPIYRNRGKRRACDTTDSRSLAFSCGRGAGRSRRALSGVIASILSDYVILSDKLRNVIVTDKQIYRNCPSMAASVNAATALPPLILKGHAALNRDRRSIPVRREPPELML